MKIQAGLFGSHEGLRVLEVRLGRGGSSVREAFFGVRFLSNLPELAMHVLSALLTGTRVLLADDDAMTHLYVHHVLADAGMDLEWVKNGEGVLAALDQKSFDCILMDIQMPVMDGVEATRKIRSSAAAYRNIPIIALTAYAMSGDRERFLKAGMDDYIAKPVEKDYLLEILKRNLRV
jgi:CheY-like chemotaxis protein